MTFEDAIREAMRVYWNKTSDYDELQTSKGPRKYNKAYFDKFSDKSDEEVVEKKAK